ncbi:MAG: hypothetical protein ACYC9O_03190 [Candidatus Latescibacterota bacterium]
MRLSPARVGFVIILFAFAFSEVVTEWSRGNVWLNGPLDAFIARFGIPAPWNEAASGLLLFAVAPAILLLLTGALHSHSSKRSTPLSILGTYAYALIPLIASTHFAKAILKSVSRFQYIPGSLTDPRGVDTAQGIMGGFLHVGGSWQKILNMYAQGLSSGVMILGGAITFILLSRVAKKREESFPLPFALLAVLFLTGTTGAIIGKITGW